MAALRQTNFLGGEVDPRYWGRTDLPIFGRGARTLRNFVPTRPGAALTRPGSLHLGYTKNSGGLAARLIPFVYSDDEAYALEFGAGYVRFWRNDAAVESAPNVPLEVATPYSLDDVWGLRFAQTGNILTLVHASHPVYELRRTSELVWAMVNLFTDSTAFAAPMPKWIDMVTPWGATTEPMFVNTPDYDGDATHPAREWQYWSTQVLQQKSTGWLIETLAVPVTRWFDGTTEGSIADLASNMLTVYIDKKVTLRRCLLASAPTYPADLPAGWSDQWDFRVLATKYYRGRGEMIGFIGTTKTRDFVDVGIEPDYATPPPRGTNPFLVYTPESGMAVAFDYPKAVAFFQERRCFGAPTKRPATLLASVTGDYFNFDRNVIHHAGEALEFELAARQWEEIRHLLPMSRLVALTNSTVRSIAGHQGSPLDFDSVDAKVDLEVGCTELRPLMVEGAALFCRTKGIGVRSLQFDLNHDGFVSADVTEHAQHLFLGKTLDIPGRPFYDATYVGKAIVDWTYAEDPWGIVWAVREDGALLSLTFAPGGYSAWARHDTDGSYKSVCAVPQGEEDAVYMVVVRTDGNGLVSHRVERMTSRIRRGAVDDDACVDAAMRFEGEPTRDITGLDHLEGKEVWVTCSGKSAETGKDPTPLLGPYTVVSGTIRLAQLPTATIPTGGSILAPTPAKVVLYIGLNYSCDFESLDLVSTDTRMKQKTVVRVGVEVDQSRGMWVGQTFDAQDEWVQRDVSDGYAPPSMATQLVRTNVRGTWDEHARIAITQKAPLPLTILAVVREVELGG